MWFALLLALQTRKQFEYACVDTFDTLLHVGHPDECDYIHRQQRHDENNQESIAATFPTTVRAIIAIADATVFWIICCCCCGQTFKLYV